MELWQFLGHWHPKLVQFPLVLLLAGLLLDAAGAFANSARARWAGLVVSALGTLGLLFAFICGIYAEVWAGRSGVPQHPIELHELLANISSWGFVILFAWRLLLAEVRPAGSETGAGLAGETIARPPLKWLRVYVVTGLIWYSLLALTGYLGGQLVFLYGAGVEGTHAAVLDMSDLNALATRQTDENLRYSEWMHHIFGWMTLGLAASLVAQAIWPKAGRKLAWIVPVFLLAGGLFLFFAADLDLYKFTDPRQFRDREVQLHKVIATVMGTIGVVGLWKLRRKARGTKLNGGDAAPDAEAEGKKSNSKLVAVLALIGGALLFTHVHTVAPYANVAAGVYIAHVVLGLIALSIGATRMLQDYLPRRGRELAMVFAVLMLAESVLLITYNEGLPWYIGYGRYNRWGPADVAGATVAPFGDFRAVMWVDQQAGEVHVKLLDRFTESPARVECADGPMLFLNTGQREIVLPLRRKGPNPEDAPEWVASAAFLKTAPFLAAKLQVRSAAGWEKVGFFDPWVTPAIAAVPPNEAAAYECPMHEGMRAVKVEGKGPPACPLCGMPMVEIRPPRPAGVLHDEGYGLKVEIAGAEAGKPALPLRARLALRPQNAAGMAVDLLRVHEQFIHLIIVSQDLTFFDHVHPVTPAAAGGAYVLDYTFPHAGRFYLFADLTPAGDRQQVFRTALDVGADDVKLAADEGADNALRVDAPAGKMVEVISAPATPQSSTIWTAGAAPGGVLATLTRQPRTIYAGLHAELIIHLTDGSGVPLTDLSPYLAAMGHCVAISEDTREFIHAHPLQLAMSSPEDRGGPDVAFHALFPKAGRYRVWAQFRRGDQLIDACFTIEVEDSPVPVGMLRFLLNE